MKHFIVSKIFRLLALILLWCAQAKAATWFVATTGSDGNSCASAQSAGTPKATIGAGMTCVGFGAGAGAGQTVSVANGTYTEAFTNPPTGTAGNVFTLKSTNSRGAIIRPSGRIFNFSGAGNRYISVEGFVLDGVNVSSNNIWTDPGANDITFYDVELKNVSGGGGAGPNSFQGFFLQGDRFTIRNCLIHDVGINPASSYSHGVYVGGGDYVVLEGSTLHTIGGNGIQYYSQGELPYNGTVRNNRIYNFALAGPDAGIYVGGGGGHVVYNNLVYQTGYNPNAYGIGLRDNTSAYNNTVYNNGAQGIQVSGSGITIRNNIAYSNGTNIVGSAAVSSNNITSNPNFVNAGGQDFHLTSGSPAIDTGTPVTQVLTDFDGAVRPFGTAYDIGAYEFGGSAPSQPPPPPSNFRILSVQ